MVEIETEAFSIKCWSSKVKKVLFLPNIKTTTTGFSNQLFNTGTSIKFLFLYFDRSKFSKCIVSFNIQDFLLKYAYPTTLLKES